MARWGSAVGGRRRRHVAGPLQATAGLDHQLANMDFAIHATAIDDLQIVRFHTTTEPAAYQQTLSVQRALEHTRTADRDFAIGVYLAFELAIDMEAAGQGQVADKAGSFSKEGSPCGAAVLRTASANDCHCTRSSRSKIRS